MCLDLVFERWQSFLFQIFYFLLLQWTAIAHLRHTSLSDTFGTQRGRNWIRHTRHPWGRCLGQRSSASLKGNLPNSLGRSASLVSPAARSNRQGSGDAEYVWRTNRKAAAEEGWTPTRCTLNYGAGMKHSRASDGSEAKQWFLVSGCTKPFSRHNFTCS